MELLNALAKYPLSTPQSRSVMQEALDIAVLTLSPMIPHVTHALWGALGHDKALIDETWLTVDAQALQTSTVNMVRQVNGKLRGHIAVAVGADEATVRATALADANAQKFIAGAAVRKVIIVPGKLVNIVV